VAGYVAEVVNLDLAGEQRPDQPGVHRAPVEQRFAERSPAGQRGRVTARQVFGDPPRQRGAVRMQAVAGDDHDLISRHQVGAQDRFAPRRDDADGAAG
jgi:hypothetical protein